MKLLDKLHGRWIHQRRVDVLAGHFSRVIPSGARKLLDVGCGDGRLAREIVRLRPELIVQGLDVFARPNAEIPVKVYDGCSLPFENRTFDVVMFADVLHHTEDPLVLLREAARVGRLGIAIKDHLLQGLLARATLSLMDWVGNASHGVALPYNYWPARRWHEAFQRIGLSPAKWETRLGLYPVPANLLFERSLHFVAFLESTPLNNSSAVE